MVIPKQDIIEGLPIRWAFHCWLTGGQWKFPEWRNYLLDIDRFGRHGYEIIPEIFNDSLFMNNVQRFLHHYNASTLAGFIRFWFECCQDYEKLLDEYSL